ncbi:MAG: hypothetical protein AB1589_46350 [Cyanobacteriota bacterium]
MLTIEVVCHQPIKSLDETLLNRLFPFSYTQSTVEHGRSQQGAGRYFWSDEEIEAIVNFFPAQLLTRRFNAPSEPVVGRG